MILRSFITASLLVLPIASNAAVETVNGKPATVGTAPCDWFKKEHDTWKTSHEVLVDLGRGAVRGLAFQKGVFKTNDGKDPYDVLDSRCSGAK